MNVLRVWFLITFAVATLAFMPEPRVQVIQPVADVSVVEIPISQSWDDAWEDVDGFIYGQGPNLYFEKVTGFRFQIPLPRNSKIQSAHIDMTATGGCFISGGADRLWIRVERNVDSNIFAQEPYNLSFRDLYLVGVEWRPDYVDVGESMETPDFGVLVEAILKRSGWVSGNSLVVLVESLSSSCTVASFNGDYPPAALVLDYVPTTTVDLPSGEQGLYTQSATAGDVWISVGLFLGVVLCCFLAIREMA